MRKYLAAFLLIAWLLLIFYFSSQPGTASSEMSGGIVKFVLTILETTLPTYQFDPDLISFLVRKAAHVFLYFVLGILTLNFANEYHIYQGKERIIFCFLFCVLYACFDETYQMFVPGRHGSISDVALDSVSSAIGIMLFYKRKLFFWQ